MTGPVESTAMGNLLTQVRASGELASLADLRAVIGKSSDVGRFEPRYEAEWQEGVDRFGKLRGRGPKWKARYY
jgi:hypothetical protein